MLGGVQIIGFHIICCSSIRKWIDFFLAFSKSSLVLLCKFMLIHDCQISYWCRYSTGFTSVHDERPSAEYAKLRKESLESEFGQALGTYSSKSFSSIYRFGPFLALYRAAIVSYHVVKLTIWQLFIQDIEKRAIKVLNPPPPPTKKKKKVQRNIIEQSFHLLTLNVYSTLHSCSRILLIIFMICY